MGAAAPSLDSIRFDTTGYEDQGEPTPGQQRVWWTPEGDGVGGVPIVQTIIKLPQDPSGMTYVGS